MDLQKYLSLYVAESGEHLAGYGRDLVELERAVREGRAVKATIDSLFRHAHSVKGMSAAMAFDGIATLAHKAEDLVDVFRGEPGRLDAAAVDVLLAAGDALAAMVQGAGRGEKPEPDAALVARVVEAARRCRAGEPPGPPEGDPFAEPPAAAPSSSPAAAAPAAPPPAADPAAGPAPAEQPAPRAHRRVQVEVDIAPGCPVPAVRAFLVVKKLAALGAVARSAPTVEDLKAGRIPGKRLEVELQSPEPLAALERALAQISDLAQVAVREAAAAPPAAAAPAAPAPAPAREAPAEPARTVRVKTEILDGFLDAVGELILATARIREVGRGLPRDVRAPLDEGVDRLHAIVKDLHDKVMTVRMTPLALVTERLPRVVRDLARAVNKQVELDVQGAEIEIDRAILEELSDPLQHVLRNAVDHGIEPPHLRLLAGKPATGRLALTARRERDRVILELADDGRGLDPERLRQAAVARGVLAPEQAAALSDREALMLCCLPGVSTADQVTELSGRGVGMDSVKRTVEALGGTLEVESAPGLGARVTFRLPLTVAVQPVLLVRVGEEVLGLPIAKVHGAAQVELSRLDRSRGEPVLPYDGELVPVRDLSRLLGFPAAAGDVRAVVVAEGGEPGRVGLAVDALLGQHEAVLKPLGSPLESVPGLSAVTVLGTGRPVFILDVQRLFA
ncbi:chemotaxis protein CheA [Anaeromyxobacter sp. Red801]